MPANQLQGELAIPVPRYIHPHATNNDACIRDAPGPTNSLPLHPRIGAAERRPHRCSGHQHGSDGGLANASQAWRSRARTTRHARTCPPCLCSHNAARQHLQRCDRGVDGPGAGDDGPPAAGGGGANVACAPAAGRVSDPSASARSQRISTAQTAGSQTRHRHGAPVPSTPVPVGTRNTAARSPHARTSRRRKRHRVSFFGPARRVYNGVCQSATLALNDLFAFLNILYCPRL